MMNILRAKCIVAGESAVGKTSIIQALQSQMASHLKSYNMTLGVELSVATVTTEDANNVVEFFFFDSSGNDVYKEVLPKYWEKPKVLVLVFDVTSEPTLKSCLKWFNIIKYVKEDGTVVPGVLLANKVDENEIRVISTEQGKEMANQLGLHYYECSARTFVGVASPFQVLAKVLYNKTTELQM